MPLRYSFASEIPAITVAPSLSELEHGIADRLKRVEEFKFIEQEAMKLGVRAWLFGGTAAGYAHYVKWDIQREKGDRRFQPDRFDYDYTNIYRSTQDLDIVIDGNAGQAEAFQKVLQEKYPHLQGSKNAWEVRLLTQDMGDKQAILNNPDFLNQHTDSNSTGLIEITKPKTGESVVRDVRDWKAKQPHFLKDIHDGALHYYFSPLHETTKFAKEGRNPPILSAIRYLTKAFQYELQLRPEDLDKIKKVISDFDPTQAGQNSYVSNWVEKNGKKLIQNAVNIEYAVSTLDKLGLRKKLAAIKGNAGLVDSLAWWMNKEPLRSHSLGQGSGKTAKELGLDIVAHETNNFLAYESITRAHTGDANVLISRENAAGEGAAYGDGFYTQVGREGARGTGLTIRFHLDPNAREGADFARASHGEYIVVKNKNALKVIPESLNIGPVEYFEMLANNKNLSHGDRGILEKLKRRVGVKLKSLTESDEQKILEIVKKRVASPAFAQSVFLSDWFTWSISAEHPEVLDALLKRDWVDPDVVQFILSQPHWKNKHSDKLKALSEKAQADRMTLESFEKLEANYRGPIGLIEYLMENETGKRLHYLVAKKVAADPYWKDYPEIVDALLRNVDVDEYVASYVLLAPHWPVRSDRLEILLKRGVLNQFSVGPHGGPTFESRLIERILSDSRWGSDPKVIETLLLRNNQKEYAKGFIYHDALKDLERQKSPGFKELIDSLLKNSASEELYHAIAAHVLSNPLWKDRSDWVEALLKSGKADRNIAVHVLSQPQWRDHPEWVETIIKRESTTLYNDLIEHVLSQPHWKDHPEWVEAMLKEAENEHFNHYNDKYHLITQHLLSQPHWKDHPEWVDRILKSRKADASLAKDVLSQPHWKDHPEWVETLVNRGDDATVEALSKYVLSQSHWKVHPEWVETIVKRVGERKPWIVSVLLSHSHWKNHPELRRLTGGLTPTYKRLIKAIKRRDAGLSPPFGACFYSELTRLLGGMAFDK